jgi:hypothetical protein
MVAIKRNFAVSGLSRDPVDYTYLYPLIGNVACSKEVVDKLHARVEKVFDAVPVDVYFMTMLLGLIDEYHILDMPLLVWSQWSQNSSTYTGGQGRKLQENYERLLAGKELEYVPLKYRLPLNCNANAVLNARADAGGVLETIEPDWPEYFRRNLREIAYLGAEGTDVEQELDEFEKYVLENENMLNEIPNFGGIRRSIRFRRALKSTFPIIIRASRFLRGPEPGDQSHHEVVAGKDAGFANFLEAANYLSDRLRQID